MGLFGTQNVNNLEQEQELELEQKLEQEMGQRIRIWDCFGPGQGLISQRNQKQFSTDWINWITGVQDRIR